MRRFGATALTGRWHTFDMPLPDDAPRWVRKLLKDLVAYGFSQVEEGSFQESFGDFYTTHLRAHVLVRPVKDRGVWRVDVTDDRQPSNVYGFLPWTSIAYLRAVAEGVTDEGKIPPASEDDQAQWLSEHLDGAASLMADPATWQIIGQLRRQSAKRRFGVEFLD